MLQKKYIFAVLLSKMVMKLKIGKKLLFIRENRKMNQTEFLDMSLSSYSIIESGETNLDLQQLIRIADS